MEWIGAALHLFFHCVDEHKGTIDKYTGDGAMVFFSLGTKEERCIKAKNCAVKISQILNEILNPYFSEKNYKTMNVRIGIDFGAIKIEKIGKKAKSQLIIVGGAANYAKRLEERGKQFKFEHYTTICLGYDLLYIIPKKYVSNSEGKILYNHIGEFSGSSEIE
jgi:class 3 adenylate cyclase